MLDLAYVYVVLCMKIIKWDLTECDSQSYLSNLKTPLQVLDLW